MLDIIIHLFVIIPIYNVIKGLRKSLKFKLIIATLIFIGVIVFQVAEYAKLGTKKIKL